MPKDYNVWFFLAVTSVCGCVAYIFHESLEYNKYPVIEYDQKDDKLRFFVTDNQTKGIND